MVVPPSVPPEAKEVINLPAPNSQLTPVPSEVEQVYDAGTDDDYAGSRRRANSRTFFLALAIVVGLVVGLGAIIVMAGGWQKDGRAGEREAAQVQDDSRSDATTSAGKRGSAGFLVEIIGFLLVCCVLPAALVIGLVVIIAGLNSTCPVCGKWWASISVRRTVHDQRRCYGLVRRSAHSNSIGWIVGGGNGSSSWTTVGTSATSWQERVPVVRTTYLLHHKCRDCESEWTTTEVREQEDFGRG
jgi:hypothetical protein